MKHFGILEYAESELRTFGQKPLSAVDSLVLSQFAYNELSGIFSAVDAPKSLPLGDVFRAEHFPEMFAGLFEAAQSRQLLCALAASPRFRNLTISHYVSDYDPDEEKQFSAMCLRLSDKLCYIAFRGTDDSLIGWKEDFSIAFMAPVPSQREAAKYLLHVAKKEKGSFILGGHSKGGNLAVYAAMCASPAVQNRILHIYDHDGPGFKDGVLDNDGYRHIKDKIRKTLPQSSLVGMLLDGHDNYTVVESRRIGILQHDPFSWTVSNGEFKTAEAVSGSALNINAAIRTWLDGLTDLDREQFVEALFSILDAGNAETFTGITREWRKNLAAILAAMKDADPEMREQLRALLRDYVSILRQSLKARVLPPAPSA